MKRDFQMKSKLLKDAKTKIACVYVCCQLYKENEAVKDGDSLEWGSPFIYKSVCMWMASHYFLGLFTILKSLRW